MSDRRLTPAPGRARAPRMWISQARLETSLLLRNGEQLLLTVIIPVILLVGLSTTSIVPLDSRGSAVDVATPGILALAVLSTAFTSQAIATGFDRRSGALRLLATTPLTRAGLIIGKSIAVVLVEALQVFIICTVALLLGWQPSGSILMAALLLLAGTAAFVSLALAVSGILRAEATLAVANGIFLLLLLAGGTVIPLDRLPAPIAAVAEWLPSNALGSGLREVLQGAQELPVGALLILVVWTGVGVAVTTRSFRWT